MYALTWKHIVFDMNWLQGLPGAIICLAFSYFPISALIIKSGITQLDHRLEQAARITHREFRVITHVTLPLVAPYIFSAFLLIFILAISDYAVPDLFKVNVYT